VLGKPKAKSKPKAAAGKKSARSIQKRKRG
jgi:hypothetical protein